MITSHGCDTIKIITNDFHLEIELLKINVNSAVSITDLFDYSNYESDSFIDSAPPPRF